jgi:hypothetical protein
MIPLVDKQNATAPDSDYPFGNIKDNPGNGTGTPVNKEVYADFHQFFEKMFSESGIVANGLPDNEYNGFQLFWALLKNISYRISSRNTFDTGDPITDINDFIYNGIFTIVDTDSNIPNGMTASSTMMVSAFSTTSIQQLVIDRLNGAEWKRSSTDGGVTWGAWALIKLAQKVIEIGDWNMFSTSSVQVDISGSGIDFKKIRSISGIIRDDADTNYYNLGTDDNSDMAATSGTGVPPVGQSIGFDSNQVRINRTTSGRYETTSFDSTSFNRGWITILYEP